MDPIRLTIDEMPRASLLEDGTLIEMEFKADKGDRIILSFDPEDLLRFASRTQQLVHDARTRKLSKGGHLSIHPMGVEDFLIRHAEGGAAVIAVFRTINGQEYPFALPPDMAADLVRDGKNAVQKARQQASETRQ